MNGMHARKRMGVFTNPVQEISAGFRALGVFLIFFVNEKERIL
jgi:hypothetical protein